MNKTKKNKHNQNKELLVENNECNTILPLISDGIFIIDNDYKITFFNQMATHISGFMAEEVIGERFDEKLKFVPKKHEKNSGNFAKIVKKVMATGKIAKIAKNMVLIRSDKLKVEVSGSIAPSKDSKGKIIGCIFIFIDITKEREIDKMKTEFISLASHQLRTPLTTIRWFIEELYGGELGDLNSEQKDYLKQVLESNSRMIKLVNDLLDISRLETSRLRIEPKLTDLFALIKSVLSEYSPVAKANNCEFKLKELKSDFPKINIDPVLIKQVINNLISNAIKYSFNKDHSKGVVTISLDKKEKDALISVSDNGIGIPEKFQRRIFQKFFRADNVYKVDTEGTGFGLYISKLIAEASGGKLWFKSAEGAGTTFYLTLPIAGSKRKAEGKSLSGDKRNAAQ